MLPTHGYTPVFLATTPQGDVVATTFNAKSRNTEADLPVILIRNPLSENPAFYAVCTNRFPATRGYSGVAVDSQGNFYVAADTGDGRTSWIRKFDPAGKLVQSFGTNGEVSDGTRFLGLAIVGNRLYTTGGFGQLRIYDTATGRPLGYAPKPAKEVPYVRDIAVDPSREAVFGVAQGAAWIWTGGNPENPEAYQLQRLSANLSADPTSGEGITFDPVSRKALLPQRMSGQLLAVDSAGGAEASPVVGPKDSSARVSDAVLLADGRTLFVSDLARNAIHVMRRRADLSSTVVDDTPSRSPAPAPGTQPAQQSAAAPAQSSTQWLKDYPAALRQAKSSQRPLLVYFRTRNAHLVPALESGFLATAGFARAADGFLTVALDAEQEALLAQQLGVYRVPFIGIYNSRGDRLAAFSGEIDTQKVLEEMHKASAP